MPWQIDVSIDVSTRLLVAMAINAICIGACSIDCLNTIITEIHLTETLDVRSQIMADGISSDVFLSLNCTDLYKRGGGA